ncbi:MAG: hypothetical protein KAI67_01970 [Candidatus Pacebacteria bacterium]|nr:hypothetical protein [Candidatus Paceibacterota bacterium]
MSLNNIIKKIYSEFKLGLRTGISKGALVTILALLMINMWYILPPISTSDFLVIALIWAIIGFFTTLSFYELSDFDYSRNLAFLMGLIATVVSMSYIYHMLTCDILPYNLLMTDIYVIFVLISLSSTFAFFLKMRMLKKEQKKLHSRT